MLTKMQKEMQLAVDRYLELYKENKRLKDEMDLLKGEIETYMQDNQLHVLEGTASSGKVERILQERPPMNSRYTTYDLNTISQFLTPSLKKKCVVEVVDKEKLESLCKLGQISSEVLELKLSKTSYSFVTRVSK